MKICYFADGRYVHAARWMKYFVARGHEMHLISFAAMDAGEIARIEEIGVKYHGHTGPFHVKKFWLTWRDLRFVKDVLKREKIDILHSHFLAANAWYGAVSGFRPHVITIMGGGDVVREDWKPDSNFQERMLTPYTLRNCDLVTAWSAVLGRAVKPYCRPETPVEVVHGGIHLEGFHPGPKSPDLLRELEIPEGSKVVFSPRLMRTLSNIDQIAAAAEAISGEFPDTHYIVAHPKAETDTAYSDRVRSIFDRGPARGKVRYVAQIEHQRMADYFRLADVMISIPDTDGTPMTVMESMACGIPSVIGDLPDYDVEYFENEKTVLMVDIKDPKSIADAAIRFLRNPDLAAEITDEARKRVVATGSYETQMSKMESLYENLMAR